MMMSPDASRRAGPLREEPLTSARLGLLWRAYGLAFVYVFALMAPGAFASDFPCSPCAAWVSTHPADVAERLAQEVPAEQRSALHIGWRVDLGVAGALEEAVSDLKLAEAQGVTPWLAVSLTAASPIGEHLQELNEELAALAQLSAGVPEAGFIQVSWEPAGAEPPMDELAYVIQRAAVAVTGVAPAVSVVGGPFPADAGWLEALYQQEIAAYLDGIALTDSDVRQEALTALTRLDPGKPVILGGLQAKEGASSVLTQAATAAAEGFRLVLFEGHPTEEMFGAFRTLAREFSGDLTFSLTGTPRVVEGAEARAWAFVRAEDLGLRVIVERPALPSSQEREEVLTSELAFADSALRRPRRILLESGEEEVVFLSGRSAQEVRLRLTGSDPVEILAFDRLTAAEQEGFDDTVEVADSRRLPVEEILRRLQAFEDDQERRLDHYQAVNTLHLRLNAERGSLEATYSGDFFFERDVGFDWVWESFYVDGVKWRSKKLPELPLLQPEKVAAQPIEIRLTKDYSYRLRGTQKVDGRDCWVVDFRPVAKTGDKSLFRGTVWVDREVFARVRSRGVQTGLTGNVLSNEETTYFKPFAVDGSPGQWNASSFVLPARLVGQQTVSVLSQNLPIERESVMESVRINAGDFATSREMARASDLTMVRDTELGLRYLRKDAAGKRVAEMDPDTSRLFLLGGVFWDESVDFPLPLAGLNYLNFDFRDSGNQLNFFFAGPILNGSLATPRLFRSRWNAGTSLSGFLIDTGDELYRDGSEVPEEEIESRNASFAVYAGRPLGNFLKFDVRYEIESLRFSEADDTAADFVLPEDHLLGSAQASLSFNKSGFNLELAASQHSRSEWGFWGLEGNQDFDADQEDYLRFKLQAGKTWWFEGFRSLTLRAERLDGEDLDRFSSYDFGLFGDSSVAGYQGGLVRAQEVDGLHFEFGVNYLEKIRFEFEGDAVWATNELTGLDQELLAGIGIGGTITLPKQIIADFEIGVALAGPGEGDLAARIFLLKLFR